MNQFLLNLGLALANVVDVVSDLFQVFPPAVSNESTYRTLLLTNIGKNPIDFSLQSEEER